jgi:hypothetical protein
VELITRATGGLDGMPSVWIHATSVHHDVETKKE